MGNSMTTLDGWTVGDAVAFDWSPRQQGYGTIARFRLDEDGDTWAYVTWYLTDGHPSSQPVGLPLHRLTAATLADRPAELPEREGIECGDCGYLHWGECGYCNPDPHDFR